MSENKIDLAVFAGKTLSAELPSPELAGDATFVGVASVEGGGVNAYEFKYSKDGTLFVLEDDRYDYAGFRPIGCPAAVYGSDYFNSVQDVQREIEIFIYEKEGDENE